jgi:aspartate racemase
MKINFGKCTALNVLNLLPKAQKNLIDYPDIGCTEITMLIKQDDTSIPVFDTTLLHATAAAGFALE